MIRDDNDPQHHKWLATFRKYSWWRGKTGSLYVIVQRWHDDDGWLHQLDILEQGKETPVTWNYQHVFEHFKKGNLSPESNIEV